MFDEAWGAMRDMLRVEGEMSGPVLVAVWKREWEVDVGSGEEGMLVEKVGRAWDEFGDSRFVREGDFVLCVDGGDEKEAQGEEVVVVPVIEAEGSDEDVKRTWKESWNVFLGWASDVGSACKNGLV